MANPAFIIHAPIECLAIFLISVGALLTVSLRLTGGHFVYVIDDSYIHLELARNLAHGHYGINPHEFSSPSSSILWPFLLIPGAGSSWHYVLPFLLNLIFAVLSALLLGSIANRWPWHDEGRWLVAKRWLMCGLLVLTGNLVALVFVGMEHSLQVLLTIGCAIGVLEALQDRPMPAWCIACAILAPSVRYENFAVLVAMTVTLIAQRRYRAAATASALSLVFPVLFSLFLLAHGSHALPNSVLVKAQLQDTAGPPSVHLLEIIKFNLKPSMHGLRFALLLLLGTTLAIKTSGRRAAILWGVVATLLLQLLFGRFGWFARYDVYAVTFGSIIALSELSRLRVRWYYAALALTVFSVPYVRVTSQIPLASFGIYAREYQMARFFREYYKKDIAVDDLGLASYMRRPGTYVLDLDGLASNEALAIGVGDPKLLEALVYRHKIGLATQWPADFTPPVTWHPIGAIFCRDETANPEAERTLIYVTADGDADEIRREMRAFRTTLPPNVGMHVW